MLLIISLYTYALIVLVGGNNETAESRIVRTTQGPVRGFRDPEGGLFTFYGIPYATAPTGRNKFKAPNPAPLWLDTLDAVDKGVVCPQNETLVAGKEIKEDCLIANVFVPDTEEKNLPVVVYVHGGAFQIGYGNMITPKHLVKTQNIIAVTFNYRLAAHGFLCLGTQDIPGNAGMKDQVAALRWVKRNIASFGGNTNDITIAGYSAGSSSVALLALSELTKGLFNKVIAESGASLGPAIVNNPLENAKSFAKSMKFADLEDVYALEEFYKTASFEILEKGAIVDRTDTTLLFAPCIEQDTDEEEFLKEIPANLLKKGYFRKYPFLYGMSNMEGLFRLPNYEFWKNEMNEKFSNFLPGDLQFENSDEKEAIANKVKELYFGKKPVGDDNILEYVNYFGDVMFTIPMLRELKMYVEAGHDAIYLYEYSFVDENTPPVPYTDVRGASHCAQTLAVLDKADPNSNKDIISKDFVEMKKVMRDLWGNFVRTGEPAPKGPMALVWPAVNTTHAPYMQLTLPPRLMQEGLVAARAQFWDDLYTRYYRKPMPPPEPLARHTEL